MIIDTILLFLFVYIIKMKFNVKLYTLKHNRI